MAITPINIVQRNHKDVLDQIAQGLQIAQGVLGVSLAVPEYLQKKKAQEATIAQNAEDAAIKRVSLVKDFEFIDKDSPIVAEYTQHAPLVLNPNTLETMQKAGTYTEIKTPPGYMPIPDEIKKLGPEFANSLFMKPRSETGTTPNEVKIMALGIKDALNMGKVLAHIKTPEGNLELATLTPDEVKNNKNVSQVYWDQSQAGLAAVNNLRAKQAATTVRLSLGERGLDLNTDKDVRSRISDIKQRINKNADPLIEGIFAAEKASKLIASGSQIGVNVAATIIAKAIGKGAGALSDNDIARYLPRSGPNAIGRIANWLTGDQTVNLTPDEIKAMNTAVLIASKSIKQQLAKTLYADIQSAKDTEPELSSDPKMEKYFNSFEERHPSFKTYSLIKQLEKEASLTSNKETKNLIQDRISSLYEVFGDEK